MKINAPRTIALIGKITSNPGMEWTREEIAQLGDHAMQIETELNEWRELALSAKDVIPYGYKTQMAIQRLNEETKAFYK